MAKILLVEPGYCNKYPPLGLMKISSYHKIRGDSVTFVKGKSLPLAKERWDRIYVSTLFTFYWSQTVDTINFYKNSVPSYSDVWVGGVLATLMEKQLHEVTGARIFAGLLNSPGDLGFKDQIVVDQLVPDYSIIAETDHKYSLDDAYIGYATRGCPNRCGFCAVSRLEPDFLHYLPLKKQVQGIEEMYGPKQNLILLDNNVLASDNFEQIIEDIIDLGFGRGAKLGLKMRRVDFNQGIDGRLLNQEKMKLLAKIALRPLRIAFDHISMKDQYIHNIRLASEYGILHLSNYVLFNYKDTPEDFYQRLRINCELNEELGTKIYSFPMKFVPLDAKDRSYIGENWHWKLLRGVQCILLVTRGLVSPKLEFFEAAFGRTPEEFVQIALMPEKYIIQRELHKNNGAAEWLELYKKMKPGQIDDFLNIATHNTISKESLMGVKSTNLRRFLKHYI